MRVLADSFKLTATNVPNSPGLFVEGASVFGGGAGTTFGDGRLCANGPYARLGVVFAANNISNYPDSAMATPIHVISQVVPGSLRHYHLWHRDSSLTFCTPATFNLTNAVSVTWAP